MAQTCNTETRFVKYANLVISVFLSKLINSCISDGTYPDSLKVAEVIPTVFLKMVVAIEVPITVLYHFFLNWTKEIRIQMC